MSHPSVDRESGSEGRAAKATASARLRPIAQPLTVEPPPKQAHGSPASPRINAPPSDNANIAINADAAYAAESLPAATPTASASSAAVATPHAIQRAAGDARPNVSIAALAWRGWASLATEEPSSTPASSTPATVLNIAVKLAPGTTGESRSGRLARLPAHGSWSEPSRRAITSPSTAGSPLPGSAVISVSG